MSDNDNVNIDDLLFTSKESSSSVLLKQDSVFDYLSKQQWVEAGQTIDEILAVDDKIADMYLAKILLENKKRSTYDFINEIKKLNEDEFQEYYKSIVESENFTLCKKYMNDNGKAKNFMDDLQESSQENLDKIYSRLTNQFSNCEIIEEYENLISEFESLGDFKKSQEYISDCKENINNLYLDEVKEILDKASREKHYFQALDILKNCDDDAKKQEYVKKCEDYLDKIYQKAISYCKDDADIDTLYNAEDAFSHILDYKDSKEKLEEVRARIAKLDDASKPDRIKKAYEKAQFEPTLYNLEEARAVLENFKDFEDTADKIKEIEKSIKDLKDNCLNKVKNWFQKYVDSYNKKLSIYKILLILLTVACFAITAFLAYNVFIVPRSEIYKTFPFSTVAAIGIAVFALYTVMGNFKFKILSKLTIACGVAYLIVLFLTFYWTLVDEVGHTGDVWTHPQNDTFGPLIWCGVYLAVLIVAKYFGKKLTNEMLKPRCLHSTLYTDAINELNIKNDYYKNWKQFKDNNPDDAEKIKKDLEQLAKDYDLKKRGIKKA